MLVGMEAQNASLYGSGNPRQRSGTGACKQAVLAGTYAGIGEEDAGVPLDCAGLS
jgi:hypothetical protein